MVKESNRPVRTCIGCMRRDAQAAMLRIAIQDGNAVLDEARKIPGRGGYLHPDAECIERFVKSKVKQFKSLRGEINREQRTRIAQMLRARLDRKAGLE